MIGGGVENPKALARASNWERRRAGEKIRNCETKRTTLVSEVEDGGQAGIGGD